VSKPEEQKKEEKVVSAGLTKVTVSHTSGEKVSKMFDFGATLAAAVQLFGEEAVFTNYIVGAKTSLRNRMSALVHGKTPLTIPMALEAVKDWKVRVVGTREGKDPTAVAIAAFTKGTPEQQAAILRALKEQIAAAGK